MAKQPGAAAQEVFLKATKRKNSNSLIQAPKQSDQEGVSSTLVGEVPPAPMVQCQDQQLQVESVEAIKFSKKYPASQKPARQSPSNVETRKHSGHSKDKKTSIKTTVYKMVMPNNQKKKQVRNLGLNRT